MSFWRRRASDKVNRQAQAPTTPQPPPPPVPIIPVIEEVAASKSPRAKKQRKIDRPQHEKVQVDMQALRIQELTTRAIVEEEEFEPHTVNPQYADGELIIVEKKNIKFYPGLYSQLKDYQIDGVQYIVKRLTQRNSVGALLAQTMGLGKTIQALTAITILHGHKELFKFIVVIVPKSLLAQWKLEYKKWIGRWRNLFTVPNIRIIQTSKDEDLINAWASKEASDGGGILLMTHHRFAKLVSGKHPTLKVIQNNNNNDDADDNYDDDDEYDVEGAGKMSDAERIKQIKKHQFLLKSYTQLLVIDEADFIRNKSSNISVAVEQFNLKRRLALTGFPIQNAIEEVFNIVC